MTNLPKFNIPGQVHFVTSNTYNRRPYFRDKKCIKLLLRSIVCYRKKYKFKLFGYVIMPDHFHLLIYPDDLGSNLCEPSDVNISEANEFASNHIVTPSQVINISKIIKGIKGSSARIINKSLGNFRTFWQKDFYDFNIYTEKKLVEKLNYIHNNPPRAGLADNPEDWLWSSYHNYYCDHPTIIKIDPWY